MEKRIFWQEKTIVFTNETPNDNFISCSTDWRPDEFINVIQKQPSVQLCTYFYHPNPDQIFSRFLENFALLEAAGGLVENEAGEYLFIYRLGKWDLPKGKMEQGELAEVTANREIEEETGATKLQLKRELTDTYHIYTLHGTEIMKISHWFLFRADGPQELNPQIEEDITSLQWFARKDLSIPLQNTYENIKQVLKAAELL